MVSLTAGLFCALGILTALLEREPGEFKAPMEPANFNGPGSWRFLCLDHVREHNSAYNYFDGMSADEISEAQNVYGGWERSVRAFSPAAGATTIAM
mgnify:CR=1 FL=1